MNLCVQANIGHSRKQGNSVCSLSALVLNYAGGENKTTATERIESRASEV